MGIKQSMQGNDKVNTQNADWPRTRKPGREIYLKLTCGQVDAGACYRLWIEADKCVGSETVVHVIPENRF